MKWKFIALLTVLGLLAITLAAPAQDNKADDNYLDKMTWGTHWAGPKLSSADDVSNKVVLLEIWGS